MESHCDLTNMEKHYDLIHERLNLIHNDLRLLTALLEKQELLQEKQILLAEQERLERQNWYKTESEWSVDKCSACGSHHEFNFENTSPDNDSEGHDTVDDDKENTPPDNDSEGHDTVDDDK